MILIIKVNIVDGQEVPIIIMPLLCVDHMIQQNPDPLTKSRPTGKIQIHWLGHKVVHIVTRNIQRLKSSFHQCFIYIHKFNKTMA